MNTTGYIGFDIHRKMISFCDKAQHGTMLEEGTIPALRNKLFAAGQRATAAQAKPDWRSVSARSGFERIEAEGQVPNTWSHSFCAVRKR